MGCSTKCVAIRWWGGGGGGHVKCVFNDCKRPMRVIMFPTITIGLTDWNGCLPVYLYQDASCQHHNQFLPSSAAWSAQNRPASVGWPRTSPTLRAADGAHPAYDLAAWNPEFFPGSSRSSTATISPLGAMAATDPGLIKMLAQIQQAYQTVSDPASRCTWRADRPTRASSGCQCHSRPGVA